MKNMHQHFHSKRNAKKPPGYILTELSFAIFLLTLIISMMFLTFGQQRKAMRNLSYTRQAALIAEETLLCLQHHRDIPAYADATVTIDPVSTSDPSSIPAGYTWVCVHTVYHDKQAQLTGLVPQSAIRRTSK